MHDLAHLHDKKLAVILVGDDGTEDGEWIVLAGVAKWRGGQLFMHRGMNAPEFLIPEETVERIKPVAPDVRDVLEDADYSVVLTVGPIPEDVDPATLIQTGFRWPDNKERDL
jgi:hypothetical protein